MPHTSSQALKCAQASRLFIPGETATGPSANRCSAGAPSTAQSERFIENRAERDRLAGRPARRVNAGAFINHGGTIGDIMVFGQESNPTTWRLAAMDMAIRGINFGKKPANSFTRNLRANYVMANSRFNHDCERIDDVRCKLGSLF